jgi:hypothetical protein
MTIAQGYLAKSATVAGVSLSGATSFSVSRPTGTIVDLRSDGELFARQTPIIPGNVEIQVETRDLAADIAVGTTGSLSLVSDKMTGGVTLTGTVTFSASSCTITSVTNGSDINGATTVSITARINSADGIASGLTVASA